MTTAADLVDALTARFVDAGIATPRADARWLVRHALGWSAADMVLAGRERLSPVQQRSVWQLGERRADREPLQLVLGGTVFRGHRLELRAGVFVPRPETELLVELALQRLGDRGLVLEPCTGSGAIACAVAAERPGMQVLATDVEPAAVHLARDNADALGVDVDVRQGWLLEPVPGELRGHVDALICNPPYLAADEVDGLPAEVARWDPASALVAGPTGHEVSDALLAGASAWLAPGGWLLLELDERRVVEAAGRAATAGLVDVAAHDDLTGRPRFVIARAPA